LTKQGDCDIITGLIFLKKDAKDMNPTTSFWIAQSISVFTGVMAIVAMQFKNMKLILTFQIIVNLLASANYLLLNGGAGAIVSFLAVIYSVVMYFYNKKNVKPHLIVVIGFMAAYVGSSVYNIVMTKNPMEILPALAAVCFIMSLMQEKPFYFRIWGAFNPSFWLAYDLFTESYVMFLVHVGMLVSSIVGMIRLDGIFKRKINK
jgi:hypothetical protein